MPKRKSAPESPEKSVKNSASVNASAVFTKEERAAMRERAQEMKAAANKADGESAVRAKLDAMAPADRALGGRIHQIIKANAPSLSPRLWYGMPAYADKGGSVVCFFQDGQKFKTRYATLGFSDKARLDDGGMWPTSYALKELTPVEEAAIAALVKKAVG
jgi:uncharacterized protein YdhG (YjbR/CyaY superfamily)